MGILKEVVTDQKNILAMNASISTSTTTVGEAIDTADFESGLYFNFFIVQYTAGNYQLKLEHSDDIGSGYVDVDNDNLVLNRATGTLPTLSALTAEGSNIVREGLVGTKRYVRPSVVSTGASSTNRIVIVAVQNGENIPIYANGDTTP